MQMATQGMRITLRPTVPDDIEFLWRLHCAAFRTYVEQTWGWDEDAQRRLLVERFDPAAQEIIECEGTAIGCLSVQREQNRIFLSMIELVPSFQRRGIGSSLLCTLQAEATEQGLPLDLRVLKVNPARRLYERLGFVVVGEIETHWLMRWSPPTPPK